MPTLPRSALAQAINPKPAYVPLSDKTVEVLPTGNTFSRRIQSIFGFKQRVHPSDGGAVAPTPDKPTDDRFNPSMHPSTGNVPRTRKHGAGLADRDPDAACQPVKTGAVNAENEVEAQAMKAFARSMLADLTRIEGIISHPARGRNELPFALKTKLLRETAKIKRMLHDCINLETAKTDNIHLFLREKFKEIKTLSKKIVAHLPAKSDPKLQGPDTAPVQTEVFLSGLFEDFTQFANELKRYHFTRANDKQLEDYADEEYRRILSLVPGLALQRKGSEMEHVQSLSASLLLGHDAFGLKFGFEGKYTSSRAKRCFIDQDGSYVSTQLHGHSYMASAVLKFGQLFPATVGESKQLAKLICSLQYKHSNGTWNEYKCLKDWMKAEIIYKGSQWKHRIRSGDPKSLGNRWRQKFHGGSSFILGDLVGIKYVSKNLIPAVNQKKREKGSYNTDKLTTLANRISTKLPGISGPGASSLATITKLAYPPMNSLIPEDTGKSNTPLALAPKQFSCLVDAASMPGPAMAMPRENGASVRRKSASARIEGSFDALDLIDPTNGQIHVGARCSAEIEWSNSHTDFLRLKAVHEHLDPRYSNDVDICQSVLQGIVARDDPTAHSLKDLGHRFSRDERLRYAALMPGTADKADIMQKKFDHQYADIQRLDRKFAAFDDLAKRKYAFREKDFRNLDPQHHSEFETELAAFIAQTFGMTEQNCAADPKRKKFYEKLMDQNDPNFFLIKGYENLSTALGAVGLDIFDNNEKILDTFTQEEFTRPTGTNEAPLEIHRNNVDIRYQNLRNRMDGVYLPIDKEYLLRNMSIRAQGKTILSTTKISGMAEASIDSAPLLYSPGNEQGATALPNKDRTTDGRLQLATNALGMGLNIGFSTLRNTIAVHSNPLRTGLFYDTRITLTGEGLLAAFIPPAVAFAEQNIKKHDYVNSSPTLRRLLGLPSRERRLARASADGAGASSRMSPEATDAVSHRNGYGAKAIAASLGTTLTRFLARPELSEFSRGGEISVIRRAPYIEGGMEYQCLLQSVRFIERSSQKVGLSAGVPLHAAGAPVPMTVSVSASRAGSDGNVLFEILGPCPSYQILSFCELQSVINKSGNSFTSFDPANLEPANFDKMRDLFLKKGGPDEQIDSDFLLHKFFGADDSIIGFMDNFIDSQNGRRQMGHSTPLATREPGKRTEFDRIDDSPEYWKTMQGMRKSKRLAPGPGSIWNRSDDTDPRPKLTEAQIADINTVKAHFAGRDISAKERMEYFTGDETGRRVFKSYCQVLRGYDEISEAMKARNAYVPKLVEVA